jgi:hypothetical protein
MARLTDNLCQRYSCLPSQLAKEDAHDMLQRLVIIGMVDAPELQSSPGGSSSPGWRSNPAQVIDDVDFTNFDHGYRRMRDHIG